MWPDVQCWHEEGVLQRILQRKEESQTACTACLMIEALAGLQEDE